MFKITQSTTGLNEPSCATLTQNKTPNKLQGSFLDDMHERSIDCEVMLHYDGELNIGVKFGALCLTKHVASIREKHQGRDF